MTLGKGIYAGLSCSERRLYDIWHTMLRRCNDSTCKDWPRYGGVGIAVCREWRNFRRFVAWAKSAGYRDDLTLDRIDGDGDYSPDNCRWTSMAEQARNRKSCVRLTVCGKTMVAKDWADALGVSWSTVYTWIRRRGVRYAQLRLELAVLAKTWLVAA